ncbi:MAG TPA: ribosome-associated translation inhibitor RaiA [Blastocatellia bacterium]|nr:ribosome-associated translation inhibitor RaiA [Blastocatellia bacterium]
MRYEFTGRHITVTPALKKHAREHLEKLDRILDSAPMQAHIILEVEKHRQNAEIVVTWRDHTFKSNASTKDMYDSITKASVKIEGQVFKLKDRYAKRKRAAVPTSTAAAAAEPKIATLREPRIVRTRNYAVKPMMPEEAAARITSTTDQFVVFRDAETNRTGVIYKRKDGNFGLIEP